MRCGGPPSRAHPPSFETHDWPSASLLQLMLACSQQANSLQRPCGTDLISQRQLCSLAVVHTFSVTCCGERERERGGRHPHQPQPPCVTIITRTDPRTLTLCALPIAIRAPRIGSAEPDLSYLREKQWMEKVKEIMSEKDINPLRQRDISSDFLINISGVLPPGEPRRLTRCEWHREQAQLCVVHRVVHSCTQGPSALCGVAALVHSHRQHFCDTCCAAIKQHTNTATIVALSREWKLFLCNIAFRKAFLVYGVHSELNWILCINSRASAGRNS